MRPTACWTWASSSRSVASPRRPARRRPGRRCSSPRPCPRRFSTGNARVLVATDVAARGLDVDDISHVFNFDLPVEPEAYVHRIGRTGRAGATGIALSFCDGEERSILRDIERLLGKKIAVQA